MKPDVGIYGKDVDLQQNDNAVSIVFTCDDEERAKELYYHFLHQTKTGILYLSITGAEENAG